MMLKRSRVKFLESEVVAYPTTQMMRNLLVAQVCAKIPKHSHCHTHIHDSRKSVDEFLFFFFEVEFKGHKLCLMTSHLESCKGHAEERMKQLRVVMRRMTEAPDDVTVVFGGDTNLRDPEASRPSSPKVLVWLTGCGT